MIMSEIERIRIGSSLDFTFDRDGDDLTNWVLTIAVKKRPEDTDIISRIITSENDKWTDFLTATETALLSAGRYIIFGKMVNSTTGEKEVQERRFQVFVSAG